MDAFPAKEQAQIRTTLAESIAGIVSRFPPKTIDGQGRCAVNEILLKIPGLLGIIREGTTPMRSTGMQLMDDADGWWRRADCASGGLYEDDEQGQV